jgi:hypothetical protein
MTGNASNPETDGPPDARATGMTADDSDGRATATADDAGGGRAGETVGEDHGPAGETATGADELQELTEVSHGAVLSLGGVSAQKVLLFLTNLVLTASLSVSAYGAYALAWRITRILVRFAPSGPTPTLVRFLPEYRNEPKRQDRVVGLAYLTTFVASVAIAMGVGVFADRINAATIQHPTFPTLLRFLGVLLPLNAFIRRPPLHLRPRTA